jgi:hypothetical protein
MRESVAVSPATKKTPSPQDTIVSRLLPQLNDPITPQHKLIISSNHLAACIIMRFDRGEV